MATTLIPQLSLRAFAVWRRNFLVWKKLAIPSMLGNLADPMIYLFGLGYGLGGMLPQVGGVPYIAFLAAGTVCASTMNAASFEALYSAFSRMHVQRTWEAIMNAPVTLDDVLAGELLWAAAKATLSGAAILVVIAALGFIASPLALWAIPVIFLTGLAFAALGLIVTADQLPPLVQAIAAWLPLTHAVALVRPLLFGEVPAGIALHITALLAVAVVAFCIASVLIRRRLLK
jgi:lipooligosaccharide transport system permease protein